MYIINEHKEIIEIEISISNNLINLFFNIRVIFKYCQIKLKINKMELKNITKEELEILILNAKSIREILIKLNLSTNGSGGYRNIRNKAKSLGLEIPKYNYNGDNKKRRKLTNELIFCENSTVARQHVKKRIIVDNLIEYKCKCGNTGEWNGNKLILQLDHKNGNGTDNRIENLRFLCPNCHSQTETHSGKNNMRF